MRAFAKEEYAARVHETLNRMEANGLDTLIVTDVANMNYLSGYDGWSFYTPQCLIVSPKLSELVLIVRFMDRMGGVVTTHLSDDNILGYPDHYVQQTDRHPMDWVTRTMAERGVNKGRIGLEMDSYFFSPMAYEAIRAGLPNAEICNANNLVNWQRIVKSPSEIVYMREAAGIVQHAMKVAVDMVEPGTRQADAVAMIYQALTCGAPGGATGEYPAIVPMLPTGAGAATPHLTWSREPFRAGEATIIEIAGVAHRYHCPMARTVVLGEPSDKLKRASDAICSGMGKVLDSAKPGMTCHELDVIWREELARHGFEKESRIGYSVGIGYPPDWGEHTASIRQHDETVLQENMCFHIIPGLMLGDTGIEISECFRITESGTECFCDMERPLVVKERVDLEELRRARASKEDSRPQV